jgi:predicted nucleic acid-binding protein
MNRAPTSPRNSSDKQPVVKAFSVSCRPSNVGEVYYRLYRVLGAEEAETFWGEAWQGLVPLTIITPTSYQLHQAAQLKGRYLIAYADAFAAQLAQEKDLPLASGDPELQALEAAGELTLIWLPR